MLNHTRSALPRSTTGLRNEIFKHFFPYVRKSKAGGKKKKKTWLVRMNEVSRGFMKSFLFLNVQRLLAYVPYNHRAFPREFPSEKDNFFCTTWKLLEAARRSTGSRKRKSLMFVVSRDETLIENYAEELGMALPGNSYPLLFLSSIASLIRC